MSRISKRLASTGALDVVATAAPGIKDILILGKVKQLERAKAADLIVLDAPAAGHAITFLLAARALLDAVRVGPINTQAREVLDLLTDAERCQVMLVTLPEETPVNELIDTAYHLEDRVGVSLGPVVVNGLVRGDRRTRRRPVARREGRVDDAAGRRGGVAGGRRRLPPASHEPAARSSRSARFGVAVAAAAPCRICSTPTSAPPSWNNWRARCSTASAHSKARANERVAATRPRRRDHRDRRLGRGRQDHDGRGARPRRSEGRTSSRRRHHRSGEAARRRARTRRSHERTRRRSRATGRASCGR